MAQQSDYMNERLLKNNTTTFNVARYILLVLGAVYLFYGGYLANMGGVYISAGCFSLFFGVLYLALGFLCQQNGTIVFKIGFGITLFFTILSFMLLPFLVTIFYGVATRSLFAGMRASNYLRSLENKAIGTEDILDADFME